MDSDVKEFWFYCNRSENGKLRVQVPAEDVIEWGNRILLNLQDDCHYSCLTKEYNSDKELTDFASLWSGKELRELISVQKEVGVISPAKANFQLIESDLARGLSLAVFDESGKCTFFHTTSNTERYAKFILQDIQDLQYGMSLNWKWQNPCVCTIAGEEPFGQPGVPENLYKSIMSSPYQPEIIADQDNIYPDKMHGAVKKGLELPDIPLNFVAWEQYHEIIKVRSPILKLFCWESLLRNAECRA